MQPNGSSACKSEESIVLSLASPAEWFFLPSYKPLLQHLPAYGAGKRIKGEDIHKDGAAYKAVAGFC